MRTTKRTPPKKKTPEQRIDALKRQFQGVQKNEDVQLHGPWINGPGMSDKSLGQFRISILPGTKNQLKAYIALLDVFKKHKVHAFKMAWFGKPPSDIAQRMWDQTQSISKLSELQQLGVEQKIDDLEQHRRKTDKLVDLSSDRDQRGKEVCVYFDPKRSNDPVFWKKLMLECWVALNKAKVEMGYVEPAYGDAAITTEAGVFTPFSYSLGLGWKEHRHGTLLSKPLPQARPNPFSKITMTWADIMAVGLKASDVQRIRELRQYTPSWRSPLDTQLLTIKQMILAIHANPELSREMGNATAESVAEMARDYRRASSTSDAEMKSFIPSVSYATLESLVDELNVWAKLEEMDTLTEAEQQSRLEQFQNLKKKLELISTQFYAIAPRLAQYQEEATRAGSSLVTPTSTMNLFNAIMAAVNQLEEGDYEGAKRNLELVTGSYLKQFQTFMIEEIAAIKNDFLSHPLTRVFILKTCGLTDLSLMEKISTQPLLMQCIFRKLVHLLREVENKEKSLYPAFPGQEPNKAKVCWDAAARLNTHGGIAAIVNDMDYWKSKAHWSWGVPTGIKLMQKHLNYIPSPVPHEWYDSLRDVASKRLESYQGFTLFGKRVTPRDSITRDFYELLTQDNTTWATDSRFHRIYADWYHFNMNKKPVPTKKLKH